MYFSTNLPEEQKSQTHKRDGTVHHFQQLELSRLAFGMMFTKSMVWRNLVVEFSYSGLQRIGAKYFEKLMKRLWMFEK